jgi:hypothetical protein
MIGARQARTRRPKGSVIYVTVRSAEFCQSSSAKSLKDETGQRNIEEWHVNAGDAESCQGADCSHPSENGVMFLEAIAQPSVRRS